MISLCACTSSVIVHSDVIKIEDFVTPEDGMPGELEWNKVIDIGHNLTYPAKLRVTAKGNGGLEFVNLNLHVYDYHDNGRYFEGGLAHVEFIDLNGDGYKDIVVLATVIYTEDEQTGESISITKPAIFIYYFDPKARSYFLKYKVADFDL